MSGMVETPIKWIATTKRLNTEVDSLERKQQNCLTTLHETESMRELKLMNRERYDYLDHIKKKVEYFQDFMVRIHAKLQELSDPNHATSKSSSYTFSKALVDRQHKDTLQSLLESFESRLSAFKLTMRTEFDHLETLEDELTFDLQQVDSVIQEIESEEESNENDGREKLQMVEELKEEKKRREQERLDQDMQHKAAIGEIDREVVKKISKL
jgi:hypothetical protein